MLNPHVNRRPASLWRRGALTLILLAMALSIAAAAQAPGATSGRITDPMGLPLPDATVRMTAVATEAVFETKADATGHFQLPDMPAGEYLISARYPGFSSQRQRIRINGPVTFALQMQVGTLRETITVRGSATTPDSPTRTVNTASSVAPPKPCGTTEVGGNIKPPRKVRDVRPRYKQAWATTNPQGTVLLQALIGVDGRVKNVEVVSTADAEMEEEALAAVSQWEFTPTLLNCEAVEVRMFVTISFSAEQ